MVVCVAALVHGNPRPLEEDFGALTETTTAAAKTGVRGWLKNIHNKIRGDHGPGCNHTHGGVLNWMKHKLGFATKTTTPTTPTTMTTTITTVVIATEASNDYGGDNDRDDGTNDSSETSSGGYELDPPSVEIVETESRGDESTKELSPQSGDSRDPQIDPRIRP